MQVSEITRPIVYAGPCVAESLEHRAYVVTTFGELIPALIGELHKE